MSECILVVTGVSRIVSSTASSGRVSITVGTAEGPVELRLAGRAITELAVLLARDPLFHRRATRYFDVVRGPLAAIENAPGAKLKARWRR